MHRLLLLFQDFDGQPLGFEGRAEFRVVADRVGIHRFPGEEFIAAERDAGQREAAIPTGGRDFRVYVLLRFGRPMGSG